MREILASVQRADVEPSILMHGLSPGVRLQPVLLHYQFAIERMQMAAVCPLLAISLLAIAVCQRRALL